MLTPLLWALAPYLVPLLFPLAVALAAFLYMRLTQLLPMQQRLIVSSMAHSVVSAIEQMVPDSRAGSQKKDQAMAWLETLLSQCGIPVPKEAMEIAIEAAVFALRSLHPHLGDHGAAATDEDAPFPWRPTLRHLPAVQPTIPIPAVPSNADPSNAGPTTPLKPIPTINPTHSTPKGNE